MRGLGAVLAVSAVVDHQYPPSYGAVARSASSSSNLRTLDALVIPPRFGQQELQLLDRRMARPVIGSAPAIAVSVFVAVGGGIT